MKTKKTPELIKHMLKELESPSKELTPWEENFIESVGIQFVDAQQRYGDNAMLSDKQFEILERIYAEKTA